MDGTPGATRLGNTKLVDYGIHKEKSDIRVHLSVVTKHVYVYRTENGVEALAVAENNGNRKVPVYTGRIKTAEGYLIPPDDIHGCASVPIPDELMEIGEFSFNDSTSIKGSKAVLIVKEMLKRQLISIEIQALEITDEMMQIEGTDIFVNAEAKIQVKCDWRAGNKELGGTGNLFIQTAECNPLGYH